MNLINRRRATMLVQNTKFYKYICNHQTREKMRAHEEENSLTVSQQRHLVSFVRVPSNISWIQVGSGGGFGWLCALLAVEYSEFTLFLLLTLLVLPKRSRSFSLSFCFSPVMRIYELLIILLD